jgi:hypothetical protein
MEMTTGVPSFLSHSNQRAIILSIALCYCLYLVPKDGSFEIASNDCKHHPILKGWIEEERICMQPLLFYKGRGLHKVDWNTKQASADAQK